MPQTDPRVDAYVDRAAPFARPLLARMRRDLHTASPALEESLRWRMPALLYRGRIVAMFAAFKAHVSLGFWHGEAVAGPPRGDGMGHFGRMRSAAELPDAATIADAVHRAIALIDAAPSAPRARRARPELPVPDDLAALLDATPAARATFDAFAPSHRREYVEWITEARRPETRARRLAQAVEWLAEGRSRHWKHEAR